MQPNPKPTFSFPGLITKETLSGTVLHPETALGKPSKTPKTPKSRETPEPQHLSLPPPSEALERQVAAPKKPGTKTRKII